MSIYNNIHYPFIPIILKHLQVRRLCESFFGHGRFGDRAQEVQNHPPVDFGPNGMAFCGQRGEWRGMKVHAMVSLIVGHGNLDLGATKGSFSRIRQFRLDEGLLLCFLANFMVPYHKETLRL